MRSIVSSRSRCRFFGQARLVLLFNQTNPSFSSNHTGFNCAEPSSRLVAITIRMGNAASFRTAGLSAAAFLAPTIDRAGDAQRLDLDLDPAGAGALVILLQVAVRELIDVVAARVVGPVDHPALDLGPAAHLLGIDQQQRDAWVTLEVLEPAAIRAAVDPERTVLLLEPHRHDLDGPVFAVGPNDRRKDLLGKRLHFRAELNCHHTTSHLNRRVASSLRSPSTTIAKPCVSVPRPDSPGRVTTLMQQPLSLVFLLNLRSQRAVADAIVFSRTTSTSPGSKASSRLIASMPALSARLSVCTFGIPCCAA